MNYYLISILAALALISCNESTGENSPPIPIYLQNPNYTVQMAMYKTYAPGQSDIVMLGDSHSFLANWNELLGRKDIAVRGIMNDITAGYLQRLEYVFNRNPKICFIEGGVNDVYANYSPEKVVKNIKQIVDSLRAHNIIPVITTTFYVARSWPKAAEKNADINEIESLLTEYCRTASVENVNINDSITENGFLKPSMTFDGIHLNANGYAVWVPKVGSIIAKYHL